MRRASEATSRGPLSTAAMAARAPDVIVADVAAGGDFLRALRADPRTRTVPVLMMTTRIAPDGVADGLSAEADEYLIKPVPRPELVARVMLEASATA